MTQKATENYLGHHCRNAVNALHLFKEACFLSTHGSAVGIHKFIRQSLNCSAAIHLLLHSASNTPESDPLDDVKVVDDCSPIA